MSVIDSNKKFTHQETKLIEDFMKSLKDDLKNKKVFFEYDLSEHGRFLGSKHEIPRGNAASEKWSDRALSDTFVVTDVIFYKIISKDEKIGQIDFGKYVCTKLFGEDISTINVTNTFEDFFLADEFHYGIGVEMDWINRKKIIQFFDDKKENLSAIITRELKKWNINIEYYYE